MKEKAYLKKLKVLQGDLVELQDWVKDSGAKVCIVFEGRDTAGKGGVIKALTERVSPRVFRVVALPAPTEQQKSQMYMQRYVPHLPSGGEVVIFDRSWYNRAGVERVFGFATEEQTARTWSRLRSPGAKTTSAPVSAYAFSRAIVPSRSSLPCSSCSARAVSVKSNGSAAAIFAAAATRSTAWSRS